MKPFHTTLRIATMAMSDLAIAGETVGLRMDTCSPVADDYFNRAPLAFGGTLTKL